MIRVIDFETTGLDPEQGAEVCEYGWVDVDPEQGITGTGSGLVLTEGWSIEAQVIHHLTKAECDEQGIGWGIAQHKMLWMERGAEDPPPRVTMFCAHNADFERRFFDPEGARWVDTYKTALRIWPDAPSHSNQGLRYWLGLELDDRAMPPHRALPDAWVTAHILMEQLKVASLADLLQWTEDPPFLTRIAFGKHKGQRWEDVPPDYLRWLARQTDLKPGVREAIERVTV